METGEKMKTNDALAQRIEKDIRQAIGELTMQTIVLRAALDMMQEQQPKETKEPVVEPPQETRERTPLKPEQRARTNGAANSRG